MTSYSSDRRVTRWAPIALVWALAACGADVGAGGDTSPNDTLSTDTGTSDTGTSDAGTSDTGTSDTTAGDSASSDAADGSSDGSPQPDGSSDPADADVDPEDGGDVSPRDDSAADSQDDANGQTDASGDADPDDAADGGAPDGIMADSVAPDAVSTDAVADASDDAAPPIDGGPAPDVDAGSDAGPAPGCCKTNADCGADAVCFFGPWNAGKCMKTQGLDKGQCWTDDQCAPGETCKDAMACGCDAYCKAADKPGTCVNPNAKPCSIGQGVATDCGKGMYCALDSGCQGSGVCKPKPEGCIEIYSPVCGCDGQTYGNSCVAASQGQNIQGKDACPNPCQWMKCGDGNACTSDSCNPATGKCEFVPLVGPGCDDGDLCTANDVCAEKDGQGVCVAGPPQTCPAPGPCETAACNAKTGKCETSPIPGCGGGGDKCSIGLGAPTIDCGATGFCKLPDGQCSGFGVCTEKPGACMMVFKPVCGCNGKDYGNACSANVDGENWANEGKCGAGGGGSGADGACCKDNTQCKSGVCAGGVCKNPAELKDGMCWNDDQCKVGGLCKGPSICPCGALCIIADKPGTCVYMR